MTTMTNPLTGYDDWPAFVRNTASYQPEGERAQALARVLGIPALAQVNATIEAEWSHGGVAGTKLSWSVGFGPRTQAWLVRPAGSSETLPGVLALHFHGLYKWLGAEQLVDLGDQSSPEARELRNQYYDGLAPANELAKRGYAVLAHDAFAWGSRRFPLTPGGPKVAAGMAAIEAAWRETDTRPSDAERYNAAASLHEDSLAKIAGVLGTSFAGTVLFDDLVALDVLSRLPRVDAGRLGCFGLSGGGVRSALLAAIDQRIRARVVTCMMTTVESLMPLYIDTHSWLFHSPGVWQLGEWPEHAAAEAERPLLVQYGESDPLFPIRGMRAADRILRSLFVESSTYQGSFYDAPHGFGVAMQTEAWEFLDKALGVPQ